MKKKWKYIKYFDYANNRINIYRYIKIENKRYVNFQYYSDYFCKWTEESCNTVDKYDVPITQLEVFNLL